MFPKPSHTYDVMSVGGNAAAAGWRTAIFNTLWALWRMRYEMPDPKMEKSWALLSEQPWLPLHLSSATAWLPPYHTPLLQLSMQKEPRPTLECCLHFQHFYFKYLFFFLSWSYFPIFWENKFCVSLALKEYSWKIGVICVCSKSCFPY